jgi:hypothetical protein
LLRVATTYDIRSHLSLIITVGKKLVTPAEETMQVIINMRT